MDIDLNFANNKEINKMRKNDYIAGLKDGIPICLGYFSVSLAFGLTAVLAGMPAWAAVVTSLTNLTSAGQFAGMNLIAAQGALIEIGLTTLIINLRYFLMSISVSQKVEQKMTLKERLAIAFGITDEIFGDEIKKSSNNMLINCLYKCINAFVNWLSNLL